DVAIDYSSSVRWLEAAQGRRSRVGDCVCFLFMMTTLRTTFRDDFPKELPLRRSHDLRWLRLHPQLLGADAAQGWTKLIEHVDVALAHAPGAPELAAGEEARLGLVTYGEARSLSEAAEDGGAGGQVELLVGRDGQRVALEEAVAQERLAGQPRMIEERLHPQG